MTHAKTALLLRSELQLRNIPQLESSKVLIIWVLLDAGLIRHESHHEIKSKIKHVIGIMCCVKCYSNRVPKVPNMDIWLYYCLKRV